MYWLVLSVVLGVTQGFGILFAQRFGAGDGGGLRQGIATAVLLCTGLGIALTLFTILFLEPLLILLNTPTEILSGAVSYLTYLFGGIGITIVYNLLSAILRSLGNSLVLLRAISSGRSGALTSRQRALS